MKSLSMVAPSFSLSHGGSRSPPENIFPGPLSKWASRGVYNKKGRLTAAHRTPRQRDDRKAEVVVGGGTPGYRASRPRQPRRRARIAPSAAHTRTSGRRLPERRFAWKTGKTRLRA